MSDSDKYPTVREILDGEAGFPSVAVHNEDGMFVLPDVTPPDMVKDEASGLYLPKPTTKQVTMIMFSTTTPITVSESIDTVDAAVTTHKTGDLKFTGPVHSDDTIIIKSNHVKDIVALHVDWLDLEDVEVQMKARRYATQQAKSQLLGVSNGSHRNGLARR